MGGGVAYSQLTTIEVVSLSVRNKYEAILDGSSEDWVK